MFFLQPGTKSPRYKSRSLLPGRDPAHSNFSELFLLVLALAIASSCLFLLVLHLWHPLVIIFDAAIVSLGLGVTNFTLPCHFHVVFVFVISLSFF